MPFLAQDAAQDVGDLGVVLDDQDAGLVDLGVFVDHRSILAVLGRARAQGTGPERRNASLSMLSRFNVPGFSADKGARAPARRKPVSRPAKKGQKRPPQRGREPLSQGQRDIFALSLLGFAVYLGFLFWGGGQGGAVGDGLHDGLEWLFGDFAGALPAAVALLAVALVMRAEGEATSTAIIGGALLLFGLLLAFAAQSAGLGEDGARREFFDPEFMRGHGGAIGEGAYWLTSTLLQRTGAHIVAIVTVASGALLISGSELRGLARSLVRFTSEMRAGAGRAGARMQNRTGDSPPFDPLPVEPFEPGLDYDVTGPNEDETSTAQPHAYNDDELEGDDEADTESFEEVTATPPTGERAAVAPPEPGTGEIEVTPMGNRRSKITESDEIAYRLPEPRTLKRGKEEKGPDPKDHRAVAKTLLEALGHFGVEAKLVGTVSGPHVSRYELQLAPGTKVSKVTQLKDDLAYALASTDIRILAPIPGKRAVGVEVPNRRRLMVRLGDIYSERPAESSPLAVWLGKDVAGKAIWADLAKMPHALVAGTTGSGKSGCINTMLCSILLAASPNEVRLVLVDPKRVELNHYESLPHLLTPVVTSPRLAANVLANLIAEMENRYEVMGKARARNLAELNKTRIASGQRPLPHILCVIDELADLMMVAPAEVEDSIIRLAQKSRAVGIHLVLATQRPSTDVITGTIKVNIPARIAFAVASQIDSRVILDGGGAESLLGQGDMLFRGAGTSKLQRIQGAFVTEDEIARIAKHWATQGEPEFATELLESPEELHLPGSGEGELSPDEDDLLADAIRLVVETESASVSMIQRRLRVGYTRAGRLIDMLERRGVISGYEGSKARQVLIGPAEIERVLSGGEAAEEPGDGTGSGITGENAFETARP